ncbi:AAA family ATPase [Paenibacillus sp. S150]|uniref:AAA family ATPase n=1 Tax=Paenibacillus sp. S150 TaxID=2749826 RepID=UPI001C59D969|nr:AAA family ATPase [Paenibacillus sp. S150]MBW4083154.1 AAA family ATPase [Paenibacillus sp. S150]
MNIEELQIGGYGRLHNRELKLNNGVSLLYGRNEAGKSTTLQFIRAMLFGIPGRANLPERYEPSQGGQHGGVLAARDRDGVLWRIRRYTAGGEAQGRSEKLQITVSHLDGRTEELSQAEMERRLLGGISRSMFRQLFAVSLDELQELGGLQSEEMSSYLFHAGMGGGGEIMRAERRLQQDADKLYKPRGKVQEAAKILQAIEKLEREAAESRSYLPRYNQNSAALEAAERQLAQLEERRQTAAERLVLLRKAQEIRGLWLKWCEARLELEELPAIASFPEDGAARWQSLVAELQNAEETVFRLKRQYKELADGLEKNPPDLRLQAQGTRIEALDRRSSSYEDKKAEHGRLEAELEALHGHLERVLRGIGAGWGTAELAGFSGTAADREAARRFAAGFSAYDRRMEAGEAERQTLRSRLAAAAAALQAADRALAREHAAGAADFAGIAKRSPRELLQLWDELQLAAERWREAQLGEGPLRGRGGTRSGAEGRRAQRYRRLLLAGAALTLLLPPALWLTGAPPVSAWAALGLLAAADLALWAALRAERRADVTPPGHGGEARAAAAEMLRLRGLLLSGAEPESGPSRPGRRPAEGSSPDAGGLEAGMKELRRVMEAWNAWRQRVERLAAEREACRAQAASLSGQERVLAAELERAGADFTEVAGRYEEWLHERKLPAGLSPEGLPDIFAMVEQGNELLRQERRLAARLGTLEAECTAFEQELLTLMKEAAAERDEPAISSLAAAIEPGMDTLAIIEPSNHTNRSEPDSEELAGASPLEISRLASAGLTEPTDPTGSTESFVEPVPSPDTAAASNRKDMFLEASSGLAEYSEAAPGSSVGSLPPLQQQLEAGGLSLLSWLELRKREWDLLQAQLLRREGMKSRLLELQEELAAGGRELEELLRRSGELLQEGGAADGEDFLRRSSAVQRRAGLTKLIRQWELAMFGGWENQSTAKLLTLLEHHDAYALEQERSAAEEAAVSIEEERNAMLQHRGKLLQEREYLRERGMEDSALQQLEEHRAALRSIAGQYAVTALAAELMGRTRRIYEQEKQPQVLLLASDYFAKLTEGEYRRVVMTLGNKELKAEHKNLGLLDSGLLSRGTAEQLYLAIRLALAETMALQANLPLLFDDLFVNFDERRLHAALALLKELSATRQIIMMTCHRHVAEAAARIIPAASVISV